MPRAWMNDNRHVRFERQDLTIELDRRVGLAIEHEVGLRQPLVVMSPRVEGDFCNV